MSIMISIGILAHNEAASIDRMLRSLLEQNLFLSEQDKFEIEIVIVPNGCTDDTAEIARATLTELNKELNNPQVQWRVCEFTQPGKCNAWNIYVHQLSSPKAKYLFLMDADIQLLDSQTLTSMVDVLERKSEAWVAVDRPIKDVALKPNKTLIESFSTLLSKLSGSNPREEDSAWICGQLYCARAKVLHHIWMPTTLPTDDSFLYTIVVTNGFKSSEKPNRVILASSASHTFEAYTKIARLLKHEKWLIFGQAVNQLLYADLQTNLSQQLGIGSLIKERNEQDQFWLNKLVENSVREKYWLIPQFILIRRFKSVLHKPPHKMVLMFPLALAAFLVDFVLCLQVNLDLRQQRGLGNWVASGSWGK